MSSPSVLSRIPVLRILVPLVLGIALHRLWHNWWLPLLLMAGAIIAYLCLSALSRSPQGRLRWRRYFILPLAVAALSLGWITALIHCPPELTDAQRGGRWLTGRVAGVSYTDFSMRLTIDVTERDLPPCRVLISTRGCDYSMRSGDLVAWPGRLDEVSSTGNPDEMDYAAYLLNNEGIRYQQHLPADRLKKLGHHPTLTDRLSNKRRELRLMAFNSQLSPATQRLIAALLLADSDIIDQATRQEFSMAGVAHILALSGLHVGVIALMIWWLLFPLDRMGLKKMRLLITLAGIALFAVFTGCPPSVLRASLMMGFVFASLIFYRRSVSLNALAMAALVILVFAPSALYSVGFQLSFITVGAILLFARVPAVLESRYTAVNYLTTTVITSLVAMASTIALTAHYFHTISVMGVVSNLLVLPVLPLFMIGGALFLLTTSAGLQFPLLDSALDAISRYVHWVVSAINGLPLSHMSGVWVSGWGVIGYYVVLALIVLWLYQRQYRYLLAAGLALAALLLHSWWVDVHTPRQGAAVFNSYTSTPILYYHDNQAIVWIPDEEEPDSAMFARYHAGFLARHAINEMKFVSNDDTLRLEGALFKPPYAMLMGQRVMAVGSGRWKLMTPVSQLDLDDIIVTKRYHGNAATLKRLYRFDRMVISGAKYEADSLVNECKSLHIKVHDLSSQGALVY